MKKQISFGVLLFSFSAFANNNNCFMKANIDGFGPTTNQSVLVEAGSVSYLVTTMGNCEDLNFADNIGFRTWPQDSMQVCEGDSIVIGSNIGPTECPIKSIVPQSATK